MSKKEKLVRVHMLVEVEVYVRVRSPKSRAIEDAKELVVHNLQLKNFEELAEGYCYEIGEHSDFNSDFEVED